MRTPGPVRDSKRAWGGLGSARAAASAMVVLALLGCRAKDGIEALAPPAGAAAFSADQERVFNDRFTATPLEMAGRAAHDVRDQDLFHARLGLADLVLLVEVDQVWGRGLYQGKELGTWDQFVDVMVVDALIGTLPEGASSQQRVPVAGDDLPADLSDRRLLWFVRWAPGESPPYHHHLMPAEEEALALARAMIEHARAAGALGNRSEQKRARRDRRGRTREAGAIEPKKDRTNP